MNNDFEMYIGKTVTTEALLGRNYHHYTNANIDRNWSNFIIPTATSNDNDKKLEADVDKFLSNKFDNSLSYFSQKRIINIEKYLNKNELADYVSESCWIKRLNAVSDRHVKNTYFILAVETDKQMAIKSVSLVLEHIQYLPIISVSPYWECIPNKYIENYESYEKVECIPQSIYSELDKLINNRYLPEALILTGKKIPERMIKNDVSRGCVNTIYFYTINSAFRAVYMCMSIDVTTDGTIKDFNISTFKYNNYSCGNRVLPPSSMYFTISEKIDTILYIIDLYSDKEYEDIVLKSITNKE